MENFMYGDKFYGDLCDLMDDFDIDEYNVASLPDNYQLTIFYCILEPVVTFTPEWIEERIDEERFPEENDSTYEKLHKALIECIDFEKLNSKIPKIYYPEGIKSYITKKDFLDYTNYYFNSNQ